MPVSRTCAPIFASEKIDSIVHVLYSSLWVVGFHACMGCCNACMHSGVHPYTTTNIGEGMRQHVGSMLFLISSSIFMPPTEKPQQKPKSMHVTKCHDVCCIACMEVTCLGVCMKCHVNEQIQEWSMAQPPSHTSKCSKCIIDIYLSGNASPGSMQRCARNASRSTQIG